MHGTTRAEQFQLRVLEVSVDFEDRVAVLGILIHVHDGRLLGRNPIAGERPRVRSFFIQCFIYIVNVIKSINMQGKHRQRKQEGPPVRIHGGHAFAVNLGSNGGRTSMVTSKRVTYTLSMQF